MICKVNYLSNKMKFNFNWLVEWCWREKPVINLCSEEFDYKVIRNREKSLLGGFGRGW